MKRTFKRAMSILLAVVMVFGTAASLGGVNFVGLIIKAEAVTSGTWGDNLTWDLNMATGTLTISGLGEMRKGEYIPPWYDYSSSIKSVVISEGITTIGNYAFYFCEELKNIKIPNSITSIGNHAFYGCSALEAVVIPEGVKTILDFAFLQCDSLATITLPNTLTQIGDYVFSHCKSLNNVMIPDSVKTIGDGAFRYCYKLENITLSKSITEINDYMFLEARISSLEIPSNVSRIGIEAFKNCNFSEITIPYGVETICKYAFSGCDNLSYIILPSSVEIIEEETFKNCDNLQFVHVPESAVIISQNSIIYKVTTNSFEVNEYICSTTESCSAKSHADKFDVEFRVCDGHGEKVEPTIKPNPVKEEIIKKPSTSTINYGETLILHADFTNIPADAKIEWSVEGNGVIIEPSADGKTCAVTSTATGDATITAKYVDADGVEHIAEQEIKSNAGIWQKIVSFFKNLFGINRTIEQAVSL